MCIGHIKEIVMRTVNSTASRVNTATKASRMQAVKDALTGKAPPTTVGGKTAMAAFNVATLGIAICCVHAVYTRTVGLLG